MVAEKNSDNYNDDEMYGETDRHDNSANNSPVKHHPNTVAHIRLAASIEEEVEVGRWRRGASGGCNSKKDRNGNHDKKGGKYK